jgi:hypothetical protein
MLLAEFFIPHGHCYLWKPELVGLHIASDALTALAYYSIPITLTYFVAKRRDVPFNWIFLLFSAFIISCGTTHILEIWTLWHPDYWLSGSLKALTAVVSIYTAFTLIGLLPQALAIPTTAHLEKEIKERQRAEAALLREKTHLAQAQKVAGVGSWEFDLATQKITWSDEIFRIFGLDRKQPTPTLSRHWQQIYPEDRKVWKTSRVQAELIERQQAEEALWEKTQQLEQALKTLQRTQAQLVQNEKMVSLGQLVAGIAHEINNPTSFIYGNIYPASDYAQNLLHLIELYQRHYPEPVTEIAEQLDHLEVDFIAEDFPKLLTSMKEGAYRISEIVQSLRNFSRLDEMECKQVDIHEGIDNTLLILKHRLTQQADRPEIQVVKEYTELPLVECYPGQLNQVFMNILCNAIDALEDADNFSFTVHRNEPLKINYQQSCNEQSPMIRIHTEVVEQNWIAIRITDNGPGLAPEVRSRIFDPFFTTKPPGKGTGLGLSISYQIVVDKHNGQLTCHSVPGQGAEFVIELPIASYYGTPRQYTQPKASEQGETKHIVSRKYSQLFLEI